MAETETHALEENDFRELNAIPNQIGYAVLAASDGAPSLNPTGDLSLEDCNLLYKMLLECEELFQGDQHFRRLNVEAGSITYSICVTSEKLIYIVKRAPQYKI